MLLQFRINFDEAFLCRIFVDEGDDIVGLAPAKVILRVELVLAEHLDARRSLNAILSHQASVRHHVDDPKLHLFVLDSLVISSIGELFIQILTVGAPVCVECDEPHVIWIVEDGISKVVLIKLCEVIEKLSRLGNGLHSEDAQTGYKGLDSHQNKLLSLFDKSLTNAYLKRELFQRKKRQTG